MQRQRLSAAKNKTKNLKRNERHFEDKETVKDASQKRLGRQRGTSECVCVRAGGGPQSERSRGEAVLFPQEGPGPHRLLDIQRVTQDAIGQAVSDGGGVPANHVMGHVVLDGEVRGRVILF